jgi:hypothetical protein
VRGQRSGESCGTEERDVVGASVGHAASLDENSRRENHRRATTEPGANPARSGYLPNTSLRSHLSNGCSVSS